MIDVSFNQVVKQCLYRSVKAANPKRLGVIERHPHYVTRRYAHFAASLLALHSGLDDLAVGIGGEEMLLNDLGTLRVEVSRVLCPASAMSRTLLVNECVHWVKKVGSLFKVFGFPTY